jgi:hypothetical protein
VLSSQVVVNKDENEDCHDDEEECDQSCSEVEQSGNAQETLTQPNAENEKCDFEHMTV